MTAQEAAEVLADFAHCAVIVDDFEALDATYRLALHYHPEQRPSIEKAWTILRRAMA